MIQIILDENSSFFEQNRTDFDKKLFELTMLTNLINSEFLLNFDEKTIKIENSFFFPKDIFFGSV